MKKENEYQGVPAAKPAVASSAISPSKTTEDAASAANAPAHTPGPWTVPHFAREDVKCNCVYVLAEPYAGSVCHVSIGNNLPIGEGGNDAPPLEEAKANARLIAAAPDLLDALKRVVAAWEPLLADADLDAGSNPAWLTVQFAKTAIAKATQP